MYEERTFHLLGQKGIMYEQQGISSFSAKGHCLCMRKGHFIYQCKRALFMYEQNCSWSVQKGIMYEQIGSSSISVKGHCLCMSKRAFHLSVQKGIVYVKGKSTRTCFSQGKMILFLTEQKKLFPFCLCFIFLKSLFLNKKTCSI